MTGTPSNQRTGVDMPEGVGIGRVRRALKLPWFTVPPRPAASDPAATIASGIRVPAAVGDFMILDAVRASGGVALATPEADIPKWMQLASSREGIALCPETAVCFGALEVLLKEGKIKPTERIVIFNTGAAQKYPEAVKEQLPKVDCTKAIEWEKI